MRRYPVADIIHSPSYCANDDLIETTHSLDDQKPRLVLSLVDAAASGDFEELTLRSIGGEATNPAAADGLDHGLQGFINPVLGRRLSRLTGEAGGKHHLPGRPCFSGLRHQGRKIRQIPGSLVDTHLRRKGSALTAMKPFGLFGRGIPWQFGYGKDKQQTLRRGLGSGSGQQLPEMIITVHEAQARRKCGLCPSRLAAVALTGVGRPIDSWQSRLRAQAVWPGG
jgi:hypothetical protein